MNKLKETRLSKGITQKELAQISGVNIKSIQKYESGERDILKAEVGTVLALAAALGVDIKEIVVNE